MSEPTSNELVLIQKGIVYLANGNPPNSEGVVALRGAVDKGFMEFLKRDSGGEYYKTTEVGSAFLESKRLRHLASIGVYEVH